MADLETYPREQLVVIEKEFGISSTTIAPKGITVIILNWDQGKSCPYCGVLFNEYDKGICQECGFDINKGSDQLIATEE